MKEYVSQVFQVLLVRYLVPINQISILEVLSHVNRIYTHRIRLRNVRARRIIFNNLVDRLFIAHQHINKGFYEKNR